MTPQAALASTRRAVQSVGEEIQIRRDGVSPDVTTWARPIGKPSVAMVGEIQQKVTRLIVLVDTLATLLPITTNDSAIVAGKIMAIAEVDDRTRRIGGTLIAIEMDVVG